MSTPPPKLGKIGRNTPPSQWATPIVTIPETPSSQRKTPPSQWATPIVTIPETLRQSRRNTPKSHGKPLIQKKTMSYGTNLRTIFEKDAHSDYLRQRLDELYSRVRDNSNSDYDDRVNETAKMVFRLPKKGGKQSRKHAKKHRKKTLKKRIRK
jgi:hypothetical protein